MRPFNFGDKVIIIENGQILTGVIKQLHDDLIKPLLIVEFEDGSVRKCTFDEVAPASVENPKNEPEELTEITITRDEFRDISLGVLADLTANDTISMLDGTRITMILVLISKKLFGNRSDND